MSSVVGGFYSGVFYPSDNCMEESYVALNNNGDKITTVDANNQIHITFQESSENAHFTTTDNLGHCYGVCCLKERHNCLPHLDPRFQASFRIGLLQTELTSYSAETFGLASSSCYCQHPCLPCQLLTLPTWCTVQSLLKAL